MQEFCNARPGNDRQHRRRRSPVDIDPDTGEEVDEQPILDEDEIGDEGGDETDDGVVDRDENDAAALDDAAAGEPVDRDASGSGDDGVAI